MSKEIWIGMATAAGCWLCYMAWLSGYQTGFEQGVNAHLDQAHDMAERFLSTSYLPATITDPAEKPSL